MQNIAFDMTGGTELHFAGADTPFYPAANDRFFGKHVAGDDRLFANDQRSRADIAIDLAIDRNVACGDRAFPERSIRR